MNPLVPFRVSGCVRLLVLGLEHPHNLPIGVPGKVAARAPLGNHARMHLLSNSQANALHNGLEIFLVHHALLHVVPPQALCRDRLDSLWGLKDGMVNLQPLVLPQLTLGPAALELGRDLVCPPLQPRIDGLQVDSAIAPQSLPELRRARPSRAAAGSSRAGHPGPGTWLCDGRIARCGRGLERGGRVDEGIGVVEVGVGVVGFDLVSLSEALVACYRRATRHGSWTTLYYYLSIPGRSGRRKQKLEDGEDWLIEVLDGSLQSLDGRTIRKVGSGGGHKPWGKGELSKEGKIGLGGRG